MGDKMLKSLPKGGKERKMKEKRKELIEEKGAIIKDLAKLETMDWANDPKIAGSIFPYVLIEAINLLKNSIIIEYPIDYTSTGENAQKMLGEVLS